jgi:hypothetical protein
VKDTPIPKGLSMVVRPLQDRGLLDVISSVGFIPRLRDYSRCSPSGSKAES